MLVSCSKAVNELKDALGTTESFEDDDTAFTLNASLIAGYEQRLIIRYKSNFVATSCSVSNPINFSVTEGCVCAAGTCSIKVLTPTSSGSGSFSYSVTDGIETEEEEGTLTIKDIVPFQATFKVGAVGYGDGDLTLTLPLVSGYNYNFSVDWGDGSSSEVAAHNDPDRQHVYGSAGDYTVTISGQIEAWSFNNTGDKDKLLSVSELGTVGWVDFEGAFQGCSNLTTVSGGDTSNVINMNTMFADAALAKPATTNWDTGNVTSISGMFRDASVATPDTSNWDTSSVTNMSWTFRSASMANPNTSKWDTSKVTTMTGMFYNADAATPDTTNWDTSSVTEMNFMFHNAELANPNTMNWDTSNVTVMFRMFYGADLANPITTNWNVSNVVDMTGMFDGATLADPDMSGWDFGSVTSISSMFSGVTLSTENYDNLLVQLDSTATIVSSLNVGTAQYTSSGAGGTARANLIGKGWSITDGGGI